LVPEEAGEAQAVRKMHQPLLGRTKEEVVANRRAKGVYYLREISPVTVERIRVLSAIRNSPPGTTVDDLLAMWRAMRDDPEMAPVLDKHNLRGQIP
jgi:hypothetical protein